MKKLLVTSGSIIALFAVAACNPAPNAIATDAGEIESTTDGGVVEPATDEATETQEPVEDEKPEAASETEDATGTN